MESTADPAVETATAPSKAGALVVAAMVLAAIVTPHTAPIHEGSTA
jgi:hypothetical protein